MQHTFPKGFLHLSNITASSYQCLIQLLPTAMRQLKDLNFVDQAVVNVYETFSPFYQTMRWNEFTEDDLVELDALIFR